MAEDFRYIRFKVIRASDLKELFRQLDDEPRPFELVVHPPIGKIGAPGNYQGEQRGRC